MSRDDLPRAGGTVARAALDPRPVWTSERAYIIAAIAGVVGLGNIWRFPYMAGEHGGGSFVIAYAVCVIALGIPLAILESATGNMARSSPVGAFRRLSRRWGPILGWTVTGITFAIMSYYFVITGWTLGYAADAARGKLQTFAEFTRGQASIGYLLAVGALVWLVLLRGVATVERVSRALLPILVVIVVGLAVYAQTLGGAGEAARFYLRLDGDALASLPTWQAAAGQAFYSLGVGQGLLIAYGSYGPAGVNLVRSTSAIAATNSTISIIAGLLVFPIVFTFGIAPDVGSELSFTAFPRVFAAIPGGQAIGAAFFALLFVAGFTSCIGGVVVVLASVRDELGISERRGIGLVVAAIVALGVPSALSFSSYGLELFGRPFLDRIDQATGSGVMLAAGLGGAALIAWKTPLRRLVAATNAGERRVGILSISPAWVVAVGRWVPLVALGWALLAALL